MRASHGADFYMKDCLIESSIDWRMLFRQVLMMSLICPTPSGRLYASGSMASKITIDCVGLNCPTLWLISLNKAEDNTLSWQNTWSSFLAKADEEAVVLQGHSVVCLVSLEMNWIYTKLMLKKSWNPTNEIIALWTLELKGYSQDEVK